MQLSFWMLQIIDVPEPTMPPPSAPFTAVPMRSPAQGIQRQQTAPASAENGSTASPKLQHVVKKDTRPPVPQPPAGRPLHSSSQKTVQQSKSLDSYDDFDDDDDDWDDDDDDDFKEVGARLFVCFFSGFLFFL